LFGSIWLSYELRDAAALFIDKMEGDGDLQIDAIRVDDDVGGNAESNSVHIY
jgi:hypothetical protein